MQPTRHTHTHPTTTTFLFTCGIYIYLWQQVCVIKDETYWLHHGTLIMREMPKYQHQSMWQALSLHSKTVRIFWFGPVTMSMSVKHRLINTYIGPILLSHIILQHMHQVWKNVFTLRYFVSIHSYFGIRFTPISVPMFIINIRWEPIMLVEFNFLLVHTSFISVVIVFDVPSQLNECSDSTTPCRNKRLLSSQDWPALGTFSFLFTGNWVLFP